MKQFKALIYLLFLFSFSLSAQSTKEELNVLSLKGENFKDGISIELKCTAPCITADMDGGTIAFSLNGKIGNRNVLVTAETPVLKGTKKIKVDKDGDLPNHQKLTIEIFGENPAVDKDVYEIEDPMDEATITILRYDESAGELEGTFSSKYFDGATAIKRLSASCHFLIKQN